MNWKYRKISIPGRKSENSTQTHACKGIAKNNIRSGYHTSRGSNVGVSNVGGTNFEISTVEESIFGGSNVIEPKPSVWFMHAMPLHRPNHVTSLRRRHVFTPPRLHHVATTCHLCTNQPHTVDPQRIFLKAFRSYILCAFCVRKEVPYR